MKLNVEFTIIVDNGKIETPFDLLTLAVKMQQDFPKYEQFILESLGGPIVDSKQSLLGLGVLICVEVKNSTISLHGNSLLVNTIKKKFNEKTIFHNSKNTIEFIRFIENIATVVYPDGVFAKLPMLTIMGYDTFAPKSVNQESISSPDFAIIIPKVIVKIDHEKSLYSIISFANMAENDKIIVSIKKYLQNSNNSLDCRLPQAPNLPIKFTMAKDMYLQNVELCKEHILEGDIYQIQLGHEVLVERKETELLIYRRLRLQNPSPYMFFIKLPSVTLIGASPELFLKIENDSIQMRPLAGTLRKTDINTSQQLCADPKEQAEHIMLVDLCRNDIGRVAQIGSIEVPQLVNAEEYSTVYHLVSTIIGKIHEENDVWDAIMACSPAGTMTGTPKKRAAEIIAEYEITNRGLYSGTVIFSDGIGNLVSALIIRTILIKNDLISVRASAGIVSDSEPEKEWFETIAKIQSSLSAVTSSKLPISK